MKDRVTQFPHRYQLVPVAGQADTYDIVAKPGTVTEEGTPINKANLLSDETAELYELVGDDANVDKALYALGISKKYATLRKSTGYTTEGLQFLPFDQININGGFTLDLATFPTRITVPANVSNIKISTVIPMISNETRTSTITLFKNGVATVFALQRSYFFYSNQTVRNAVYLNTGVIPVVDGDYFQIQIDLRSPDAILEGALFIIEEFR